MQTDLPELSLEIYHRIYRLLAKGMPSEQVAMTLGISAKTVRNVSERFSDAKINKEAEVFEREHYLDIYTINRSKFVVLDLNGAIRPESNEKLRGRLGEFLNSDCKALALLMKDVYDITVEGFAPIILFNIGFVNKGRYCAILNPCPIVESYITKHEIEKKIPVFGTEKAFEDAAFKAKNKK